MAGETQVTVVGNLTDDITLKFTNTGVALASFTVASAPRTFDRQTNEWRDGEALFLRCTVWREYAENVAQSLTKGLRVIVQGNLVQRSYETDQGEKRTSYDLQVSEVGPALRYATATVVRAHKQGQGASVGASAHSGVGEPVSGAQNDGWHNPAQEDHAPF